MRTLFSFIVTAAIFLLSSCTEHKKAWITYSDNVFRVKMPEKPVIVTTDAVKTPFGIQKVHTVSWKPATLELSKFKLFQVSYIDCPGSASFDSMKMNKLLDSSINWRKRDFPEETDIISQPVTINVYPGRAFILDPAREDVITIVKQVIARNRRFELIVIAKRNSPTNSEINDFFNSFQVL